MDKVAEQTVADPGLVVRVLKTVNSAAYGLRRSVDSMQHACSLMGRSHLESLVLSLPIREVLPDSPSPGFEAGRFWTTAFRRASLARLLAARFNPSRQAQCFTAGLLLDMAVPLLAQAQARAMARSWNIGIRIQSQTWQNWKTSLSAGHMPSWGRLWGVPGNYPSTWFRPSRNTMATPTSWSWGWPWNWFRISARTTRCQEPRS